MRSIILAVALVAASGMFLVPAHSTSSSGPWLTGAGHDHRDPSQHDIAWNMVETSWDPLRGDVAHMSGAHAMEVRSGHLFVAAFGDMWSTWGGLYIFDLADPAHPARRGEIHGLGPMGGDRSLDVTIDGDFAVLGTEALPAAYTKTGIVNPTPPGLLLIDTRNKDLPLIVDHSPSLGIHSVVVARINGEDYVFTTDAGLTSPGSIHRIDRASTPPQLVNIGNLVLGHDASIYHDPVLGKPLLVTADGSQRLVKVFDVSNPASPVQLGRFRMPVVPGVAYYAHSAVMVHIEGKRVIVASSENEGNEPTPIFFLDADHLAATNPLPVFPLLSTWKPPVGGGPGLVFSLHNPRIVDGILYYAHYHAGVVVFDVSTLAKVAAPELVAYAVPHRDTGYRMPLDPAQQAAGINAIHYPRVYDVAIEPTTKTIYAADIFTGVYTYQRTP